MLSARELRVLLYPASALGSERAFDDLVPLPKFPGSASPGPVLALPSLKVLQRESSRSHLELVLIVTSRAPDQGRPKEAAETVWVRVADIPGLYRHTISGRYYASLFHLTHARRFSSRFAEWLVQLGAIPRSGSLLRRSGSIQISIRFEVILDSRNSRILTANRRTRARA